MKIFLVFISLILSINAFDFGETTVKLNKISGGTIILMLYPENSGTTEGSDLNIKNLKLICNSKEYPLICPSNKQHTLNTEGSQFQCSISESITSSQICVLYGLPSIQSTGDNFTPVLENSVTSGESKFGDTKIGLESVEGKKVVIKIYPQKTGTTSTDDLFIHGLIVQSKELTCKAGEIITLEATTGTSIECTTTEEIDANLQCKLEGSPGIFSTDDTFGKISLNTNKVYSSFGLVKIGIVSVKGTTVTINVIPEFQGTSNVEITGLKINDEKVLTCPEKKNIELLKQGTQFICTISSSMEDDDLCTLTENNLSSSAFSNLIIDESNKACVAGSSKYGKVDISLLSVIGTKINILIKTAITAVTESNKFTILGLSLTSDNKEYSMTCSQSSKIELKVDGTEFPCTITTTLNGGKECKLKGVPNFVSEGDTFSDITLSTESEISSFGKITISLLSIIGNSAKIKLKSEYSGITTSNAISIDNLKWNGETLSCPVGNNINFSNKPEITCSLNNIAEGNIKAQLLGNNPSITMEENSKDIFGDILLDNKEITSSFGQLKISLISVIGNKVKISLESEYIGTLTNLNINNLKLNNKLLKCQSGSVSLELKKSDETSDANIECSFDDTYFSIESNTLCSLTGSPSASIKLFTSQIITSNYQVNSGTRNFGDINIYLYSIKGTTVYIQLKSSLLSGKVRPIISNLKLKTDNNNIYNIQCDITDKIQLYADSKTKVKCYISNTINSDTSCNLINQDNTVGITADNGDQFGNIIIDTETINAVRPSSSTYGNTEIKLNKIIGNEITINIIVSQTTIINYANPVIHNLYLDDGTELYCVSQQSLTFTDNQAQMKCTSSTEISCTTCKLTGNPTIISLGDSEDTFGDTSISDDEVSPQSSTLGNINIKLNEVIGTDVYIDISSTKNGQNTQHVDINNIYIDGQLLICSEDIKFSTTPTKMKCTIEEPIPYDKPVTLTGTPSIKIDSDEESIGLVEISENSEEIKSKSNSVLNIELISVKENFAIITINAVDLTNKILLKNFNLVGLSINDVPFEIFKEQIYLGGGPVEIRVDLSEQFDGKIPCSLKGLSTSQCISDGKIFGPINNPSTNIVYSTNYKFGIGTLYLLDVFGKNVNLKISSTKSDLTQNTKLNDLYINNNHLICNLLDNIEIGNFGTEIQCALSTPIDGNKLCTLYYRGHGDDNFEEINIKEEYKTVYSKYQIFGNVNIELISINGNIVKILVKTRNNGITTTDNVQINNLFINDKSINCQFYKNIEFSQEGTELDCTMDSTEISETSILTAREPEIISFGDQFEEILIDPEHNTIRTEPKDIDGVTLSLSSVAEKKVSIKFQTEYEIYTNVKIKNLRIKNLLNFHTYDLNCPNKYINLIEKNNFINYIICDITIQNKIQNGFSFALVDSDDISIESFDNFENINIETNEVISTKFGDIILNPISVQIVIDAIPTNQERTLGPSIINNLKLLSSSEFSLDCKTQESIELKSSGTKLYCTLKGSIGLSKANEDEIILSTDYIEDSVNNILLEQKFYDTQNTNCYSLFDKTSCELNPLCIYTKDSFYYCDKNNEINNEEDTLSNNECILYINEDKCNSLNDCFWNEENKYTCKPKEIKNCEKLLKNNMNKCEKCINGYELNKDSTKCILVDETYYPCSEYNSFYYTCISKSQCEYHYDSYSYCTLNPTLESNTENDCHLYIMREACNSQEKCIWKTNPDSGCKEKYIENCIKLRESDPNTCEKCEDGYYLLGGVSCTRKTMEEYEQCEKLADDKENCDKLSFCEYSRRAYCYGGEGCYRYLSQDLCESAEICYWNTGNWNKCKIKEIPNCSELNEEDATTCIKCKDGYELKNYGTICKNTKEEMNMEYTMEHINLCNYYNDNEYECNYEEFCEFDKRSRCEGDNEDSLCPIYLNQNLCEENKECHWINYEGKLCHLKRINNCLLLNVENIEKCEKCEDGYTLAKEDTQCINSKSEFVSNIFFAFALILFLI